MEFLQFFCNFRQAYLCTICLPCRYIYKKMSDLSFRNVRQLLRRINPLSFTGVINIVAFVGI